MPDTLLGHSGSVEFRVTLGSIDSKFPVRVWIGDDEDNARGAYRQERKRWAGDAYMVVSLQSRPVGDWAAVDD